MGEARGRLGLSLPLCLVRRLKQFFQPASTVLCWNVLHAYSYNIQDHDQCCQTMIALVAQLVDGDHHAELLWHTMPSVRSSCCAKSLLSSAPQQ